MHRAAVRSRLRAAEPPLPPSLRTFLPTVLTSVPARRLSSLLQLSRTPRPAALPGERSALFPLHPIPDMLMTQQR